MSNLGSLVVEISANVARFQGDMGKVAHLAEQSMARVQKVSNMAATALKGLAAGAVAGFTANAFKSGIEGAITAAAELQQMSEKTGASVEALSGLKSAAKMSGTSLEELGGGLVKLGKSMYDAAGGGEKASAHFKALGIAVTGENGQLRDSGEVMLDLATKLAGMENATQASAVAVAVLGKRGAELMPFMRDLAEIGELNAKVTTEMAAEADAYEKSLVRLEARKKVMYNTIAQQVLPVMRDFVDALLTSKSAAERANEGVKALASEGKLTEWARAAAKGIGWVVNVFDFLSRVAKTVGSAIGAVAADVGSIFTFLDGLMREVIEKGDFGVISRRWGTMLNEMKVHGEAFAEDMQATISAPFLTDKLQAEFDKRDAGLKKAAKPKGTGSIVPIVGAEDAKKSPFAAFLEELDRMVVKASESEYAMLRLKAQQIALKDSTANLGEAYKRINALQRGDSQRAVNEYSEKLEKDMRAQEFAIAILGESARKQEDLTDAMQRRAAMQDMVNAAQKSGKPLDTQALQDIHALTESQIAAAQALRDRRDATTTSFAFGATKALQEYVKNAADASKLAERLVNGSLSRLEDAFINFAKTGKLSLSSLFGFMAEEYLRSLFKMQAAKAITAGGGADAFSFSTLFSAIGSYFSGGSHANGLDYVPYDGYRATLHRGERVQTALQATQARRGEGGAQFDLSISGLSVGAGVSRAEMQAAVTHAQGMQEARIRRLIAQGAI